MMYLISACLAGVNCKYNGGNNECQWVKDFMQEKDCMLVCPEQLGQLPTPRPPAEFIDGRIVDKNGRDVTDNFMLGAKKTLENAVKRAQKMEQKIELAILKANSPSCGCGKIYDGTFSGVLIEGDGVLAAMLKEKGIPVITELQAADADQMKSSVNLQIGDL
jgi:uncharacterized protein YbbK (DUF523 family)